MSKRRKIQKEFEFLVGFFSLFLSNILSFVIFRTCNKILDYSKDEWMQYVLTIAISFCVIFFCFSSPINLLKRSKPMEIGSTLRNCALIYALISVLLILTKNEIIESRYMFVSGFVLFTASSLAGRYALKKIMLSKITSSRFATMTGVISTYERAQDFIPKLCTDWSKNVKAVAIVDAKLENGFYKCKKSCGSDFDDVLSTESKYDTVTQIDGVPVVANRDNLMGWIRTASLDEVFINLPDTSKNESVIDIIEELEDMGITVHINIPSLESIIEESKFDNLECIVKSGYPMAVFSPVIHNSTSLVIKDIIDFVGGLIGSIVSLPIILITAIPLKLESPGPLIFKQQRVGKNGRIFNVYKLRSMYVDAEERKKALMEHNKMDGHMFKMDNDPRITKVGKFIRKYSIDELPQFWNVIKGDMSLVGTRPPTIDEFEKYESHHKRRLSLKPGITGMWQVSGRSNIKDFEDVVALDCEYIDNWSVGLDIKILFKTVGVVLTHKGAE